LAKFPPEKIAEIRDRVRLEAWAGRTVELRRQGRRHVGLCPFHSEKSPSFGVSADKQLFHCFGCGAGGDLFDYVMRIEGLDFPEAVRLLAREAGVELPEDQARDPAAQRRAEREERLYAANAAAQETFRDALAQSEAARAYLETERALSPSTIERFELGWAPPDWSHLASRLSRAGVRLDDAVELGLLRRRARDGKPYDQLRGRLTFPIRVPGGRVAGFGARRADWVDREGPKYLNSPESPIYDKSRVLYGLPLARDDIRKRRRALLVEGYLDVILLAQAGLTHTVAGCGTALTAAHAKTLARLTDEVVTLFDGDLAGRKATHAAAALLLAAGVEVRVVPMPEGADPDDLVRAEGAPGLRKRIDEAPSAIDFFLARARAASSGGGVAGTAKAMDAVKPLILAMSDPLARDVATDACARELGIDTRTLRQHLGGRARGSGARGKSARRASHSGAAPTRDAERPRVPPPPVWETELLTMLLEDPDKVLGALESRQALDAFSTEPVRAVIAAARAARSEGRRLEGPEAIDVMRATDSVDDAWLGAVRARLVRASEGHGVDNLIERLLDASRQRRLRELRERLARSQDPEEQDRILLEVRRVQSGER
jgi:DNA primase